MPFTVKDLIGDRGAPVTAKPDDSVRDAYARMRENDFSQLPVVEEDGQPIGLITNGAILRALSHLGTKMADLRVLDATHVRFDAFELDDDLFEALDRLGDNNAVLVVNADNKLTGIVTSFDATEFFRNRYEDMMLVEDVESTLKDLIRFAFTNDTGELDEAALGKLITDMAGGRKKTLKAVRAIVNRYLKATTSSGKCDEPRLNEAFNEEYPLKNGQTLDNLTFNDFTQMLVDGGKWDRLSSALGDSKSIKELLDKVRDTRNALAHFRGKPSPMERDALRYCNEQLTRAKDRLSLKNPIKPAASIPSASPPSAALEQIEPTAELEQPDDSRYARLARFLTAQPTGVERIDLSFDQVQQIIRGRLPESARQHRSWWANDTQTHIQSRLWLEASWRVADINLSESRVTFARIRERDQLYLAFNTALQNELRTKTKLALRNVKSPAMSWLWLVDLPEGRTAAAHLGVSFALRDRFRVELYIDSGSAADNKALFDRLHSDRQAIEAIVGMPIQWERLDDKRASRIAVYHRGVITDTPEELEALRAWAVDKVVRFHQALAPHLR
jgi:CBS domain-containing protein